MTYQIKQVALVFTKISFICYNLW